ncbi:thymidylate kinase [Actinoplanes sp. NBC_00393]|uniref:thymidylate kinase n=1 Tax=Actinoplanes sp. NBC_00393 TaxID=2975953 RepID=UPI002E233A51
MALLAQSPSAGRRVRTVALVGIDGSGKTTQAHRLAAELAAAGLPAVYRRNAGGRHWFGRLAGLFGKEDGEQLLGRRAMLGVESVLRWLAIARTLLRRALRREIAVMDRYAVCQYASLRSHGARPSAERRARLAYRLFPKPDVTLLLAVDPEVAHERIERRGYDHESMDYLRAATKAYESLPEYPDFVVIDANGTPDQVSALIRVALLAGSASLRGDRLVTGEMAAEPTGPVALPEPRSPEPEAEPVQA